MKDLGRISVREVFKKKYPFVESNTRIPDVMLKFDQISSNVLPVFEGDRFVGEIHEIDILRMVVNQENISKKEINRHSLPKNPPKTAAEMMNAHEITIDSGLMIEDAAFIMLKEKIQCLPVIENQKLIGIITQQDISKAIVRRSLDWDV